MFSFTVDPLTGEFGESEKTVEVVDLTAEDGTVVAPLKKKPKKVKSEIVVVKEEVVADFQEETPLSTPVPSPKKAPKETKQLPTVVEKTPPPKKKTQPKTVASPKKTTPMRAAKALSPYLSPDAKRKRSLEASGDAQFEFFEKVRAVCVGVADQDFNAASFQVVAFGQVNLLS
jgi:hypothetical protein